MALRFIVPESKGEGGLVGLLWALDRFLILWLRKSEAPCRKARRSG